MKMGPPTKVPPILVELVATDVEVSKVRSCEFSGKDIWQLIGPSMHGTAFQDKFKTDNFGRGYLQSMVMLCMLPTSFQLKMQDSSGPCMIT